MYLKPEDSMNVGVGFFLGKHEKSPAQSRLRSSLIRSTSFMVTKAMDVPTVANTKCKLPLMEWFPKMALICYIITILRQTSLPVRLVIQSYNSTSL